MTQTFKRRKMDANNNNNNHQEERLSSLKHPLPPSQPSANQMVKGIPHLATGILTNMVMKQGATQEQQCFVTLLMKPSAILLLSVISSGNTTKPDWDSPEPSLLLLPTHYDWK